MIPSPFFRYSSVEHLLIPNFSDALKEAGGAVVKTLDSVGLICGKYESTFGDSNC